MPHHHQRSSRLTGFFKRSLAERIAIVGQWAEIEPSEQMIMLGMAGLNADLADKMIENVVGIYGLPLGIATNFRINEKDYLIPMVIEEPSVVAAASNAARLARDGGGFYTSSSDPLMIGQIQVLEVPDMARAIYKLNQAHEQLLALMNDPTLTIVKIGGGPRDLEVRILENTAVGPMLVLHVIYDVRDAMGANVINTACEELAPVVENLTGGRVNLRILSNYADKRLAAATCLVPAVSLKTDTLDGPAVVQRIVEAAVFAEADPYRAVTHNKGVMNGIDAVVLATGNDWRAVEASAHAYASRDGVYRSMTEWWQDDNADLRGRLRLPMAVGTVGGATRVHPVAKLALRILGVESAQELSEVLVAVGLAQNLAAIRALATEGIQSGHMSLHARQLAIAAGATGDLISRIAESMIEEGNIRLERARQLLSELD
jgi:hydroxymethylglutaryl-CoA reductase